MKPNAGKQETELKIFCYSSGKAPNYKAMAPELPQRCREFYQDPENEKAFQEWLKSRKSGGPYPEQLK